MTRYMDYRISTKPIRIVDLKVDKSKLKHTSLTILDVGHLPGRTYYRTDARFVNKWAIVYISDGSGTYRVDDGEKQRVNKNSLFLFYPGPVFHFGPDPGGYWDEYYFTVEGPRIRDWLDTWLFEPGTVKAVEIDDAQKSKIERIFMLMDSGVPVNADRAALLLESLLFEFMANAPDAAKGDNNEAAIQLLYDISESLYRPFDAAKLCQNNHISLSTLKRTVSKYTGYPLNEYVHRLKIAEAKNILLNSGKTLKEIAASLGYKDVFYFSRLFKKYVGVSPKLFRTNK
ncbi:AraC family transcriptional regulator [Paenibacillus sp. GYB003]|uniref:AraC family transcriptional regulator n=1 Tax=Paenibacillus sp. GYB003 TaxID=2994392 RepID=UPI002F968F45